MSERTAFDNRTEQQAYHQLPERLTPCIIAHLSASKEAGRCCGLKEALAHWIVKNFWDLKSTDDLHQGTPQHASISAFD